MILTDLSLSDDEPTSGGMGAEDPEPVESIDPDDYVLMQLAGKRSYRYNVGKVVSVDCLSIDTLFMRRVKGCRADNYISSLFLRRKTGAHTHGKMSSWNYQLQISGKTRKNGQTFHFPHQQAETLCPWKSIAQLQRERCISWLCFASLRASLPHCDCLATHFVTLGLTDKGCICHLC